jgi:hypothetical protein
MDAHGERLLVVKRLLDGDGHASIHAPMYMRVPAAYKVTMDNNIPIKKDGGGETGTPIRKSDKEVEDLPTVWMRE